MAKVVHSKLMETIRKEIDTIYVALENGWFPRDRNGEIPCVLVRRLAANEYYVCWNYQAKDTLPGQEILPTIENDFEAPMVVAAVCNFTPGFHSVNMLWAVSLKDK